MNRKTKAATTPTKKCTVDAILKKRALSFNTWSLNLAGMAGKLLLSIRRVMVHVVDVKSY